MPPKTFQWTFLACDVLRKVYTKLNDEYELCGHPPPLFTTDGQLRREPFADLNRGVTDRGMITAIRLTRVGQSLGAAAAAAVESTDQLEAADIARITQIVTTYLGTFLGAFPTGVSEGTAAAAPAVPTQPDPGLQGVRTNTRYFKFACTVLEPYASLSIWPFITLLTASGVIGTMDDDAFLAYLEDHARVRKAMHTLARVVCENPPLVQRPPTTGMPQAAPSLRTATFTVRPVPQRSLVQLNIKGQLAAIPLQYPLIVFKDSNVRLSPATQPVTCLRAYVSLPLWQVPHALCLMRNAADLSQRARLRMGLELQCTVTFRTFYNSQNATDQCLGFTSTNPRTEPFSGTLPMTGVIEQVFVKDDTSVMLSLILDDASLPWFRATPSDPVAGDVLIRFLYARAVLIVTDPSAIKGLTITV